MRFYWRLKINSCSRGLWGESNQQMQTCKGLLALFMRADQSQFSLHFYPARSVLLLQLVLATLCFVLIAMLPVVLWIKWPLLSVVILAELAALIKFFKASPNTLFYKPVSDKWYYNDCRVYLQSEQFVTRNLVILYLVTVDGKKLTQVAPADAMPRQQHIALRKLLIERLSVSPFEQSHPDQQS